MSNLFDKLAAGEMGLGVWIKGGPSWVSTIARAGFDFVRPDMMFSAIDWRELDHINRTAQAVGISTWVRVPANPWLAGPDQLQVTVDVARAFSLGIPFVGASIASAAQARACMEVSRDWHRSGAGEYPNSSASFAAMNKKEANAAIFVPHIEAGNSIKEIDEIINIDGLRIIMLAMTDLSQAIGLPFEYDHPDLWRAVDGIVAKAHARSIVVAANMGYAFTTPEQMRDRVKRMHDHGIRICLMQGADIMLENLAKAVLKDIRGVIS
jgi:2-keto-3-deoxy-L-rhamnonate aldolase RhmA